MKIRDSALRLDVPASTLRFYDKEGLLPFVERLPGGIRMFQDTDLEWLQITCCMKKAGMSIRDIRQYIEQAQRGDDTIVLRLAMFRRQREFLPDRQELRMEK
ncbi:MAG TPA: MerR family transcriptional regulator [Clostridiales bacterium]|nr:MerR family transcriptional regulator [Clostridiales bacterium]